MYFSNSGQIAKIGNHTKILRLTSPNDPGYVAESLAGNSSLQTLQVEISIESPNMREKCEKMFQRILELPKLSEIRLISIPGTEIPLIANFLEKSTVSTVILRNKQYFDFEREFKRNSAPIFEILEHSTTISHLELNFFEFHKSSVDQWNNTFSRNKTLCALYLYDCSFSENSFEEFLGALFLSENLRKLAIQFFLDEVCDCVTEKSLEICCDIIRKNLLVELNINFCGRITPKMSHKILLAIKANTSIKKLHLIAPLESDALSILCEIISVNTSLTYLAIGTSDESELVSFEAATAIKNHLKNNTTISSIILLHTQVPSTFFCDLLAKNIISYMRADCGVVNGKKVELSDVVPLFWNYSLVSSYLSNEYKTKGDDAFTIHCSVNKGTKAKFFEHHQKKMVDTYKFSKLSAYSLFFLTFRSNSTNN